MIRGTGGGITHEIGANAKSDFGLQPIKYGAIDGFVRDETGTGIADVQIGGLGTQPIRTNADGYYRSDPIALDEDNSPSTTFVFVDGGRLDSWVAVKPDEPPPWHLSANQPVTVISGQVTRAKDFLLRRWRPAAIAGTVVEGTPDPVDPTIVHPTSTTDRRRRGRPTALRFR